MSGYCAGRLSHWSTPIMTTWMAIFATPVSSCIWRLRQTRLWIVDNQKKRWFCTLRSAERICIPPWEKDTCLINFQIIAFLMNAWLALWPVGRLLRCSRRSHTAYSRWFFVNSFCSSDTRGHFSSELQVLANSRCFRNSPRSFPKKFFNHGQGFPSWALFLFFFPNAPRRTASQAFPTTSWGHTC